MTIGELIGAGTRLEGLGVIAACSAAFYVGAIIGSIAVATGRPVAKGTTFSDVVFTANKYNPNRSWLAPSLQHWSGIHNCKAVGRKINRLHAMVA